MLSVRFNKEVYFAVIRCTFLKLFLSTLFVAFTLGAAPLLACKTAFTEPQTKLFSQNSESLGEMKSYLVVLTEDGLINFQQLSNYFEFDTPLPSTNSSLIIHESALRNWKAKQHPVRIRELLTWIRSKISDDKDQSQKQRIAENSSKNAFRPIVWVQIREFKGRWLEVMDTRLTREQYFDLLGMNSEIVQRRLQMESSSARDLEKNIPINGLAKQEIAAVSNALSKRLGAPSFYPNECVDIPGSNLWDKIPSFYRRGHLGVRMLSNYEWSTLIHQLSDNLANGGGKDNSLSRASNYINFEEQNGMESYSVASLRPLYLNDQKIYDIGRVTPEVSLQLQGNLLPEIPTGCSLVPKYRPAGDPKWFVIREILNALTGAYSNAYAGSTFDSRVSYHIRLIRIVRQRR